MSTKTQKYKARQSAIKSYRVTQHQFDRKVMNWNYCSGCGLVALKNDVTIKAMAKPCTSMEE